MDTYDGRMNNFSTNTAANDIGDCVFIHIYLSILSLYDTCNMSVLFIIALLLNNYILMSNLISACYNLNTNIHSDCPYKYFSFFYFDMSSNKTTASPHLKTTVGTSPCLSPCLYCSQYCSNLHGTYSMSIFFKENNSHWLTISITRISHFFKMAAKKKHKKKKIGC